VGNVAPTSYLCANMPVQFYDSEYQNTGTGKRVYTNLTGNVVLDVYKDLGDDLLASGVQPQQYPPGDNPAEDWARVFTCYPFLRVTAGIDEAPFLDVPETRYKIGSYSMQVGREVIVNEDDSITTIPYYAAPTFITYERNCLRPFRFAQIKEYLSAVADTIDYEIAGITPAPAEFYYLTSFYFGSNALENGYGIALNIDNRFTVDYIIYYVWGTLQLSGTGTIPKIIFPY